MRIVRAGCLWLVFLLVPVLAQLSPAAFAQTQTAAAATPELKDEIEGIAGRIDAAEREIAVNEDNDVRLVEIRGELEGASRRLEATSERFAPRLAEINARLEQIGPAPSDATESAAVAQERTALLSEKSDINALIGQVETLSSRIKRLTGEIATLRRQLFTDTLSRRYNVLSVFEPRVLQDARAEFVEFYERIAGWLGFIVKNRLSALVLTTVASLAGMMVLLIWGRRSIGHLLHPDPAREEPSYLSRLSVVFWTTLLKSGALSVFLIFTYYFFSYFDLLRSDVAPIMATTFNVIATVYFINCLAHSALSPELENWRLVNVESEAARRLYWLISATSVVTGIDFIINRINEVQSSPVSLTVAKSLVATVIVGILLILISLVKPFRSEEGEPRPWGVAIRYPLRAIAAATIIAALLGYIGLARFISQQVVVTGALLAAMYIGILTARALSDFGAFSRTMLGRGLLARFDFDEQTQDQFGLLASVVIHGLVLLIGIPLILLQWGFQWGDIWSMAYGLTGEVTIGSIRFSLGGIVTGIVVVFIGYFLTRWLQGWLDDSVMTRGRVDPGVRNSIRTIVGYVGIGLAALIGISAAGINLSNLALIAGALSLGIGFGLQNIVSNFVSGLILLAERPFKAGDLIVAGSVTGTVKRINVRATEIETGQRQIVVLPNSELINAAVGNWTHRNKLGRVDIQVPIAHGADPRRVHALLDEIARSHPSVLKNPQPSVAFSGFTPASMDFVLYIFLADITSTLAVTNEIRFSILERLAEEGIRIPQPAAEYVIRPDMPPELLRYLEAVEAQKPPAKARGARKRKPSAGPA